MPAVLSQISVFLHPSTASHAISSLLAFHTLPILSDMPINIAGEINHNLAWALCWSMTSCTLYCTPTLPCIFLHLLWPSYNLLHLPFPTVVPLNITGEYHDIFLAQQLIHNAVHPFCVPWHSTFIQHHPTPSHTSPLPVVLPFNFTGEWHYALPSQLLIYDVSHPYCAPWPSNIIPHPLASCYFPQLYSSTSLVSTITPFFHNSWSIWMPCISTPHASFHITVGPYHFPWPWCSTLQVSTIMAFLLHNSWYTMPCTLYDVPHSPVSPQSLSHLLSPGWIPQKCWLTLWVKPNSNGSYVCILLITHLYINWIVN